MLSERPWANKERIKEVLPLKYILPNIVTLFSLSCGMTAIKVAIDANWSLAAILIIAAAIFDGLDGRIARMLSGTSKFGAELDSLSDFISFGVAPAIVMYLWALDDCPKIGWAVAIIFAVCCALRLARFNTMLEDKNRAPYWDYFFTGMPAPAGAVVGITPLMLWLDSSFAFAQSGWFVGFFLLAAAGLMASRVPTICIKKLKIRAKDAPLLMVLTAVYVGFLITQFWLVLSISSFVYLAVIPLGLILFKKMKQRHEEKGDSKK